MSYRILKQYFKNETGFSNINYGDIFIAFQL